jgi:hypothetical protein
VSLQSKGESGSFDRSADKAVQSGTSQEGDTFACVCFSPEGDLVGGLVVTAIGVDAYRHLRGQNNHLLFATVPLVLGIHQLDESLVWWSLEGPVPHSLGRVAMWIYLVIAMVVVPILVPLSIWKLQPTAQRRRVIAPFVGLGIVIATILLITMLRGPVTVSLGAHHLAYSIGLRNGILIVGLYVVATCGALLLSGYRDITIFGIANLIAVVVLARLTADGFASLWCAYAALAAGFISIHMRLGRAHRAKPYALS